MLKTIDGVVVYDAMTIINGEGDPTVYAQIDKAGQLIILAQLLMFLGCIKEHTEETLIHFHDFVKTCDENDRVMFWMAASRFPHLELPNEIARSLVEWCTPAFLKESDARKH